jgi:hypothetical protein
VQKYVLMVKSQVVIEKKSFCFDGEKNLVLRPHISSFEGKMRSCEAKLTISDAENPIEPKFGSLDGTYPKS